MTLSAEQQYIQYLQNEQREGRLSRRQVKSLQKEYNVYQGTQATRPSTAAQVLGTQFNQFTPTPEEYQRTSTVYTGEDKIQVEEGQTADEAIKQARGEALALSTQIRGSMPAATAYIDPSQQVGLVPQAPPPKETSYSDAEQVTTFVERPADFYLGRTQTQESGVFPETQFVRNEDGSFYYQAEKPLSQTEHVTPRGVRGVAGIFSAMSGRPDVRKYGLYQVEKERFDRESLNVAPEGHKRVFFEGKRALGLSVATNPEYYIAAPAAGALFGYGASVVAASGVAAATGISLGGKVLLGYAAGKTYLDIKAAPTIREKAEIGVPRAVLFTEGMIGGMSGSFTARKAGFIPQEAAGLKFRTIAAESASGKKQVFYRGVSVEYGTKSKTLIGYRSGQHARVTKMYGDFELDVSPKTFLKQPFSVPKQQAGIVKGTPQLDLRFIKTDYGLVPKTSTDVEILSKSLTGTKLKDAPLQFKTILEQTKGVKAGTVGSKELPLKTSRLGEKQTRLVLEYAKEQGAKVFGSYPQQAQVKSKYVRDVADIDIKLMKGTPKKAASELTKILLKSGVKARSSKAIEGAVEVKVGGKYQKAVEFKSFLGADKDVAPSTFAGVNVEGRPVKIQDVNVQSLEKQTVAKMSSAFTVRSESGKVKFSPETHRIKDISDFFATADSALSSKTGTATGKSALLGLKSIFPKESLTFSRGGQTFAFDYSLPSPSPSISTALSSATVTAALSIQTPKIEPKSKSVSVVSRGTELVSLTSPSSKASRYPSLSISPSSLPSPSPSISPSISPSPSPPPPSPSPSHRPSPSPSISTSFSPSTSLSPSPSGSPSLSPSPSYSPSYSPSSLVPSSPPPPPPPLLFGGLHAFPKKKKTKAPKAKQKKKYRPSLLGIDTKTKKRRAKFLTGLEIRGL